MNDNFYLATSEDVKGWLNGEGEYLSPAEILTDLTEEQATTIPPGSPYSIAQVLAHMNYWQARRFAILRGEPWQDAKHLSDTFAPPAPGAWDQLVSHFLVDLETIRQMADAKQQYSYADRALHNGYHLGQIALLRQMLGIWPPAGGESYDF